MKKELDAKGISVKPLGLNYEAVSVPVAGSIPGIILTRYDLSVTGGVEEAQQQLKSWLTNCSGKVILLGYSQGADVLTRLLHVTVLSGAIDGGANLQLSDRVLGTAMFGNPQFNPKNSYNVDTGYDKYLYGFIHHYWPYNVPVGIDKDFEHGTRSCCLPKDPVFNYSKANLKLCDNAPSTCTHITYEERGLTVDAAHWLANRAKNSVLAPGLQTRRHNS